MSSPLVSVRNLSQHFHLGRDKLLKAVDNVTLDIHEGEILGLVGESGSGKSTLGKTLLGLLHKTSGEVHYRDQRLPQRYSPKDFRHWSKRIQMIFQDPYSSLNPRMTAGEIIGEGLRLHTSLPDADVRQRVSEWLVRVGLAPDHASRYPHEFSGGQRQRIGVARALVTEPEFLVCDEPISALDVSVQAQIVNLLDDLKGSMSLTMLFIAHDLSMVRYISDRMAVMYLGGIVEIGTADQVFFAPKHPYTRLLVAANPEADPNGERARPHEPLRGEIPSPINLPPGCRFAARCPHATDICRQQDPPLAVISGGEDRLVACHLYR